MSLQNVTLADLQHLPYGSTLFIIGHGDVLEKRPNVARYGTCELVMQLVFTCCSILGGGRIFITGLLGKLSRTGLNEVVTAKQATCPGCC
jgi:hypothetical protein